MAVILDGNGRPVQRGDIARVRARALLSGGVTPYDAADQQAPEMAGWMPWLGSPDTETTPYRDQSVARIRDLVRNDGWAAGAVARLTDSTIGADFRLSAQPDYRALSRRFGAKFDAAWAKEFSEAAEAGWRSWAYDPLKWCDTARAMTVPQMFRLAFRHYIVEGEALAVLPWRPDRRGYGRARYATTLQVIDPDRLSNPSMAMDQRLLRGGQELDEDGVVVAYHIRKAHINDWFNAGESVTWERVERETEWGRPQVVHHFDAERAGQHRPIGGMFVPVLARMRMLSQYDRVELQAAIINSIFGAYIESPFDAADIEQSLQDDSQLSQYQRLRSEFHQDRRLMAGNVRLATLFPGEKINTITASRPAAAFEAFEGAILRNLATSLGMSFETVSGDYRGSSYSSARQALIGEWRTVARRRVDFGAGVCNPVYVALLEEMIDRRDVPLPAGAPDFAEIRAELARCRWIGPGRGYIDITKETDGMRMQIASGMTTLENACESVGGSDWIENLEQLALEKAERERLGLDLVYDTALSQQKAAADIDQAEKPAKVVAK
jgi:lambda family phage portal protein